jgi:hypothetical protein
VIFESVPCGEVTVIEGGTPGGDAEEELDADDADDAPLAEDDAAAGAAGLCEVCALVTPLGAPLGTAAGCTEACFLKKAYLLFTSVMVGGRMHDSRGMNSRGWMGSAAFGL